jgi:hypothetical protein
MDQTMDEWIDQLLDGSMIGWLIEGWMRSSWSIEIWVRTRWRFVIDIDLRGALIDLQNFGVFIDDWNGQVNDWYG